MNQRFKQLAEQAKKDAFAAMIKISDKDRALSVYADTYDLAFAELIVKECLTFVEPYPDDYGDEWDRALGEVRDAIKEHFGM